MYGDLKYVKLDVGLSGTMLIGPISVSTATLSHGTVRFGYLHRSTQQRMKDKVRAAG